MGTPKDAIDRLNCAVIEVLADPAFIVERARAVGMEPTGGTPQDMDKLLRSEIEPAVVRRQLARRVTGA